MITDHIFRFDDKQQGIHYPKLKFVHVTTLPGMGAFQVYGKGDIVCLALNRISLNDEGLILMRKTPELVDAWEDVIQFHRKFGLDYDGPPRELPPEIWELRKKQHAEETQELLDAKTLEDRFDALLDQMYFCYGTIRLYGWNFKEGWRRVHEKNMEKIRAKSNKESKRGSSLDVVKPPGWTPPVLTDLVAVDPNLQPPDNNLQPPDNNLPENGGEK